MMTSQDKFALKNQNLSRPLPQKKMLLLLLTERMEVMVSSSLIILLWNSIRLNILPPLVLISNLLRVLLNSNKEKLRNQFLFQSLTKILKKEMKVLLFNFQMSSQLELN